MKIGLIDVDGHHFPNIALMKLSAWHNNRKIYKSCPTFEKYSLSKNGYK